MFIVSELPKIDPFVVSIWYGMSKPSSVEEFLYLFIQEMKHLIQNGLNINSHLVTIRIRCFICDTPARAFLKGKNKLSSSCGCIKIVKLSDNSRSAKL